MLSMKKRLSATRYCHCALNKPVQFNTSSFSQESETNKSSHAQDSRQQSTAAHHLTQPVLNKIVTERVLRKVGDKAVTMITTRVVQTRPGKRPHSDSISHQIYHSEADNDSAALFDNNIQKKSNNSDNKNDAGMKKIHVAAKASNLKKRKKIATDDKTDSLLPTSTVTVKRECSQVVSESKKTKKINKDRVDCRPTSWHNGLVSQVESSKLPVASFDSKQPLLKDVKFKKLPCENSSPLNRKRSMQRLHKKQVSHDLSKTSQIRTITAADKCNECSTTNQRFSRPINIALGQVHREKFVGSEREDKLLHSCTDKLGKKPIIKNGQPKRSSRGDGILTILFAEKEILDKQNNEEQQLKQKPKIPKQSSDRKKAESTGIVDNDKRIAWNTTSERSKVSEKLAQKYTVKRWKNTTVSIPVEEANKHDAVVANSTRLVNSAHESISVMLDNEKFNESNIEQDVQEKGILNYSSRFRKPNPPIILGNESESIGIAGLLHKHNLDQPVQPSSLDTDYEIDITWNDNIWSAASSTSTKNSPVDCSVKKVKHKQSAAIRRKVMAPVTNSDYSEKLVITDKVCDASSAENVISSPVGILDAFRVSARQMISDPRKPKTLHSSTKVASTDIKLRDCDSFSQNSDVSSAGKIRRKQSSVTDAVAAPRHIDAKGMKRKKVVHNDSVKLSSLLPVIMKRSHTVKTSTSAAGPSRKLLPDHAACPEPSDDNIGDVFSDFYQPLSKKPRIKKRSKNQKEKQPLQNITERERSILEEKNLSINCKYSASANVRDFTSFEKPSSSPKIESKLTERNLNNKKSLGKPHFAAKTPYTKQPAYQMQIVEDGIESISVDDSMLHEHVQQLKLESIQDDKCGSAESPSVISDKKQVKQRVGKKRYWKQSIQSQTTTMTLRSRTKELPVYSDIKSKDFSTLCMYIEGQEVSTPTMVSHSEIDIKDQSLNLADVRSVGQNKIESSISSEGYEPAVVKVSSCLSLGDHKLNEDADEVVANPVDTLSHSFESHILNESCQLKVVDCVYAKEDYVHAKEDRATGDLDTVLKRNADNIAITEHMNLSETSAAAGGSLFDESDETRSVTVCKTKAPETLSSIAVDTLASDTVRTTTALSEFHEPPAFADYSGILLCELGDILVTNDAVAPKSPASSTAEININLLEMMCLDQMDDENKNDSDTNPVGLCLIDYLIPKNQLPVVSNASDWQSNDINNVIDTFDSQNVLPKGSLNLLSAIQSDNHSKNTTTPADSQTIYESSHEETRSESDGKKWPICTNSKVSDIEDCEKIFIFDQPDQHCKVKVAQDVCDAVIEKKLICNEPSAIFIDDSSEDDQTKSVDIATKQRHQTVDVSEVIEQNDAESGLVVVKPEPNECQRRLPKKRPVTHLQDEELLLLHRECLGLRPRPAKRVYPSEIKVEKLEDNKVKLEKNVTKDCVKKKIAIVSRSSADDHNYTTKECYVEKQFLMSGSIANNSSSNVQSNIELQMTNSTIPTRPFLVTGHFPVNSKNLTSFQTHDVQHTRDLQPVELPTVSTMTSVVEFFEFLSMSTLPTDVQRAELVSVSTSDPQLVKLVPIATSTSIDIKPFKFVSVSEITTNVRLGNRVACQLGSVQGITPIPVSLASIPRQPSEPASVATVAIDVEVNKFLSAISEQSYDVDFSTGMEKCNAKSYNTVMTSAISFQYNSEEATLGLKLPKQVEIEETKYLEIMNNDTQVTQLDETTVSVSDASAANILSADLEPGSDVIMCSQSSNSVLATNSPNNVLTDDSFVKVKDDLLEASVGSLVSLQSILKSTKMFQASKEKCQVPPGKLSSRKIKPAHAAETNEVLSIDDSSELVWNPELNLVDDSNGIIIEPSMLPDRSFNNCLSQFEISSTDSNGITIEPSMLPNRSFNNCLSQFEISSSETVKMPELTLITELSQTVHLVDAVKFDLRLDSITSATKPNRSSSKGMSQQEQSESESSESVYEACPSQEISKPSEETVSLSSEEAVSLSSEDAVSPSRGDLVWGQLGTVRWWPAMVILREDCGLTTTEPGHTIVIWFGDYRVSELSNNKLVPFVDNFRDKYKACRKGVKSRIYRRAVLEAIKEQNVRQDVMMSLEADEELLDWASKGFQCEPLQKIINDIKGPPTLAAIKSAKDCGASSSLRVHCIPTWIKEKLCTVKRMQERKNAADAAKKGTVMGGVDIHVDKPADLLLVSRRCKQNVNIIIDNDSFALDPLDVVDVRFQAVRNGKLSIEDVCIVCGCANQSNRLKPHPYFCGGACPHCLMYCIICGVGGFLFVCENVGCSKVYCVECVTRLVGNDAPTYIRDNPRWSCYLCSTITTTDSTTHPDTTSASTGSADTISVETSWEPGAGPGLLMARKDWFIRLEQLFQPHIISKHEIPQMSRGIRVLSLFDGIGSGLVALKKLDIKVDAYYCSEIDGDRAKVTHYRHHEVVKHLGCVTTVTLDVLERIGPIDLVIGCSPCNNSSVANPSRRGLDGGLSQGLFFEFVRVLLYAKLLNRDRPLLYVHENVVDITDEVKTKISRYLQCQPIVMNAIDFTPVNRFRYFWGNVPEMYWPYQYKSDIPRTTGVDIDLFFPPKALHDIDKTRTVTASASSMREIDVEMSDRVPGNFTVQDLEPALGFPAHYTDISDIPVAHRWKILVRACSVPIMTHILSPLAQFFPKATTNTYERDLKY